MSKRQAGRPSASVFPLTLREIKAVVQVIADQRLLDVHNPMTATDFKRAVKTAREGLGD